MKLVDYIKRTPLLRPPAFPANGNVALVCRCAALPHIPDSCLKAIRAIYVLDPDNGEENHNVDDFKANNQSIPVFDLEEIRNEISFDIVHFHHKYEYDTIASTPRVLMLNGFKSFYNFIPIPYNKPLTSPHVPGYYRDNKDDLEDVFELLTDKQSKKLFASRIRAIETGNIGYMRVSKFLEYFHPALSPADGDVVIDGGVSESISAQVHISNAIGEKGKAFGFEPDPVGFCKANDSVQEKCRHKNYKIVPLGLWEKKATLHFDLNGQGTHVSSGKNPNSVQCDVISIDEFVQSCHIKSVQFIKLDVEGAEFEVIKGAIKTITMHKPKLAISLYHKLTDLFTLPKLIHELSPEYKMYIGHHHGSLHETILYATTENNAAITTPHKQ